MQKEHILHNGYLCVTDNYPSREHIIKRCSWKTGHAWNYKIGSYRERLILSFRLLIFHDWVSGFGSIRGRMHETFPRVSRTITTSRRTDSACQLKKLHTCRAEKLIHMYANGARIHFSDRRQWMCIICIHFRRKLSFMVVRVAFAVLRTVLRNQFSYHAAR